MKVLLISFILTTILSCVGSVQETKKEITYGEKLPSQSNLSFGGVHRVVPISHSRIEVYFYPAAGGSQDYSYLIYNSESSQPITVNEQSVFRAYGGLYMYTLTNLDQGKTYSIRIDAKDNHDDSIFQTDIYKETSTFSNRVANFHGISSAVNAPGMAGIDSIIVSWPQAEVPASPAESDYTTKEYRIIVLDSTNKGSTPTQLHDESLSQAEGRTVYSVLIPSIQTWNPLVDNYTVTGLQENTVYYIGVQCIHESSIEDPSYIDLFGERNNRWIQIKTLSSNFSDATLEEGSFTASAASGAQAFTSIGVQWGQIDAIFDHIRIYYGSPSAPSSYSGVCETGQCKKITNTLVKSTMLADLESLTDYEIRLVVCADATCEDSKLLATTNAETSPNIASFNGITSITPPQNITELGSLTINFSAPDFTAGYFEGLRLYYVDPGQYSDFTQWQNGADNVSVEVKSIDLNPTSTQNLYHDYFDINLHTSFKVHAVSSEDASDQHCFALVPYNLDSDGEKIDLVSQESATWECSTYNPSVPSVASFSGLSSANTTGGKISLFWDVPITGIYTDYALFIKTGSGSFVYDNAISTFMNPGSDYSRLLLPTEAEDNGQIEPLTSYHIFNLETGTYYVGLKTLYLATGEYSDNEENIFKCDVNTESDANQQCVLVEN